jgi:hypothetical protein
MRRIISTIIVPAMILMPVYAVASEIDAAELTEDVSVNVGNIPMGLFITPNDAETGLLLSLNYAGTGSYVVPDGFSGYRYVEPDIGIALDETPRVALDTKNAEEGESGGSLTTWIIVGVLAAVAVVAIILAVSSSSGDSCGG